MANKTSSDELKATDESTRSLLGGLSWVPLEEEMTAGQHGLTPLLLQRFAQHIPSLKRTVAQVLVDRLLERALDGHHQSLEEIMTRIDGDAKSNGPAVKPALESIQIDEPTAQRVLDALQANSDQSPGD
jgi:hypothetical protein